MALNEAEARKNSATALDETTGVTSEVAQREHPREEDHAPGRRQMLSAQVPAKSEKDSTASPSKGRAGTERRERSRTAALETAGERSMARQVKKPLNEHGASGRRQQPQVQEYDKSEESTTSKESTEVEDEHSPLAPTSRPDLVPRDSQGPFPMKGHRRTKGDSDHQSSPEQTSSSDESSGDASSEAIEGASANPLNSHPNAFVRASYRLSAKIIRRRMKSAADKTEQLAGQAQSDAVDPIEGTSRGTLSEPTLAERHSDLLSDYPPDLRASIEDGMVATLDQMSTQASQLGTDSEAASLAPLEGTPEDSSPLEVCSGEDWLSESPARAQPTILLVIIVSNLTAPLQRKDLSHVVQINPVLCILRPLPQA
ncbi:uncharacterized protein LOC119403184 [Rhipicephalus sanguineus]|uniref:uncharacterized protein LOC119403184 n=1 Tax=Rhipicephalus sanguineus TaxID=34632 RepID=UPI0020C598A0|nr:uncharacterized protein LOC119403184 [Rhipicephalus sanguineus]